MQTGQINRGTILGDYIYNLVKERKDILTIVESGTWNGLGTTRCILDGLRPEQKFWSIELYPDMYELALKNNQAYVNDERVKFMLGSLIKHDEIYWFDHSQIDLKNDLHASLWFHKDIDHLKKAKNVLDAMPSEIDLLILDGGEYSTYPEWVNLKNRTKVVVLDDSSIFKCSKIAHELSNDNSYRCLIQRPHERNGFAIYEKNK